jgi:hypothetical protein
MSSSLFDADMAVVGEVCWRGLGVFNQFIYVIYNPYTLFFSHSCRSSNSCLLVE